MDPKTLRVIDKILSTPEQITDVFRDQGEFYFRFKGYAFSIIEGLDREEKWGPYSFYVYPKVTKEESFATIAERSRNADLADYEMVSYHTGNEPEDVLKQLGTLVEILKRKHSNLDQVFDDILGS